MRSPCGCFECRRREGITEHKKRDSLGKLHWSCDGRYLARLKTEIEILADGSRVEHKRPSGKAGVFVGG